MNSVNIIGRLVRDPEIKRTDEGLTICDLRIAVDDIRSREDRADFINVSVFGGQADLCERYLKKGFITGVTGRIRSDMYTNSEGVKKYPVKIIADSVQFLQWPTERSDEKNAGTKEVTEPMAEEIAGPATEEATEPVLEEVAEAV